MRHAGRKLRAGAVQGRSNTHGEACDASDTILQWPDSTAPLPAPPCAAHCVRTSCSRHSHGLLMGPSTVLTCDHTLLQMKALCEVPRNGLQLLPYYARITATLSRVFPDVGEGDTAHGTRAASLLSASAAATSLCACGVPSFQQTKLVISLSADRRGAPPGVGVQAVPAAAGCGGAQRGGAARQCALPGRAGQVPAHPLRRRALAPQGGYWSLQRNINLAAS